MSSSKKKQRRWNVTSPCRSATSLSLRKERDVLAKPKQGEVKGQGFAVKVCLSSAFLSDAVSLLFSNLAFAFQNKGDGVDEICFANDLLAFWFSSGVRSGKKHGVFDVSA
jgi:hypothetical protein